MEMLHGPEYGTLGPDPPPAVHEKPKADRQVQGRKGKGRTASAAFASVSSVDGGSVEGARDDEPLPDSTLCPPPPIVSEALASGFVGGGQWPQLHIPALHWPNLWMYKDLMRFVDARVRHRIKCDFDSFTQGGKGFKGYVAETIHEPQDIVYMVNTLSLSVDKYIRIIYATGPAV